MDSNVATTMPVGNGMISGAEEGMKSLPACPSGRSALLQSSCCNVTRRENCASPFAHVYREYVGGEMEKCWRQRYGEEIQDK